VDTKDNWTELLEEALNKPQLCKNIKKFEVINLGVAGYDIRYAVERYKLRGQKYNPDLILWLLKNDDFQEIVEETTLLKGKFIEDLKQRGLYDEEISKRGTLIVFTEALRQALEELDKEYGREKILSYQKLALEEINKYFSNKLLIFDVEPLNKSYEEIIKGLINNHKNVMFLDHSFGRYDQSKASFLPYDGHPNREGHKIIAEDLFNYLTKNKILSCN